LPEVAKAVPVRVEDGSIHLHVRAQDLADLGENLRANFDGSEIVLHRCVLKDEQWGTVGLQLLCPTDDLHCCTENCCVLTVPRLPFACWAKVVAGGSGDDHVLRQLSKPCIHEYLRCDKRDVLGQGCERIPACIEREQQRVPLVHELHSGGSYRARGWERIAV
jgi:hypothetical protein